MIVSCVPKLLDVDDDMECFTDYFIALDPEAGDNESKLTTFTQNLKDQMLPKFSDEDCYADRYRSPELMQTDLSRNAQKAIMDRFEEKDKDAQLNIQVDHFALNWKPYVLKSKIEDFNVKPKNQKDENQEEGSSWWNFFGKGENNEENKEKKVKKPTINVGGHPIDDLVLAETLNKIVDKYDYAIDDYLAIKYLVDE